MVTRWELAQLIENWVVHHRVSVEQFTEMLPPACIDTVDVLQQSAGILAEKWYGATFRGSVYFLDCSEEGLKMPHCTCTHTHTHTHTCVLRLFGLRPGLPRWAGTRTNLDFTEAGGIEWQWYQLGHMQICTSPKTVNHTSTPPLSLQTRCPSCHPTVSKHWRQCSELLFISLCLKGTSVPKRHHLMCYNVFVYCDLFMCAVLVLLVIVYMRCLQHPKAYGSRLDQHDDVRENIIHYDEEGVGESLVLHELYW